MKALPNEGTTKRRKVDSKDAERSQSHSKAPEVDPRFESPPRKSSAAKFSTPKKGGSPRSLRAASPKKIWTPRRQKVADALQMEADKEKTKKAPEKIVPFDFSRCANPLSRKDLERERLQEQVNKLVQKADYTPEEIEELKKFVMPKLHRLDRPVGKLAHLSKNLGDTIRDAVDRSENFVGIVRGNSLSGKKLMIDHALKSVNNIVPVRVTGNANEKIMLQQIWVQLNPLATNKLETFTDFKRWFCKVIEKQAGKKQAIVLVIDHFEECVNREKQLLLYVLLDGMHRKEFHLVILGITMDASIQITLERRLRSRAEFVPISVPRMDKEEIINVLKAYLMLGARDGEHALSAEFKETYNKIARMRIRELVEWNRDVLLLRKSCGSKPLVLSILDRCIPLPKLINGTFEATTPGDLSELSDPALLICVAMTKMHDRGSTPITFEKVLWELRSLWAQQASIEVVKDPDILMHDFRHLISRGYVTFAPVPSTRFLIPEEPAKISLCPVTFSAVRVMQQYIAELKRPGTLPNPLLTLPTIALQWCKV